MNIIYTATTSQHGIKTRIRECIRRRKNVKDIAESLSIEHRTQLALAREEAGLENAAVYLRGLNRIENQRRLFQNIRVMEKNIKVGVPQKS